MSRKLLIVEEHPAPYRDETFQKVSEQGVELHILTEYRTYAQNNHNEWLYQSPMEAFRTYSAKTTRNRIGVYRSGFIREVRTYKPDVICSSSLVEGFLGKLLVHSRFVYRSDNIHMGNCETTKWKALLLKTMLKTADAMWVPGNAGMEAYQNFISKPIPIYQGAYTNDADRIWENYCHALQQRSELKEKYRVSNDKTVFLFVGKLIPSRHIEILCESLLSLGSVRNRIEVIVCGNGPTENILKSYMKQGLDIVHVESVSLSELEDLYAISDAYIHPGGEPYSLALYEAAICGLPIVASKKVGAVSDCVQDQKNGIITNYLDVQSYTEAMTQIAENYSYFKENAMAVHEDILLHRGVQWSASELMKACGWEVINPYGSGKNC